MYKYAVMAFTQITLHFCLFNFLNLLECYMHIKDASVVCVSVHAQYVSQQYVFAHYKHVIAHVHRHAAGLHVKQLINCSSQKVFS
jgi:hypothetical protein